MNEQQRKTKERQKWLQIYEKTGSVTITANRCGIARSTLYRWIKRYNESSVQGLSDKSRRPHTFGNQKVDEQMESTILELRKRKWGPQRISNHLKRTKGLSLSAMTIWKVLAKHKVPKVKKHRKKSDFKRYSRPVPGDRVQLDTFKLRPGAYQFTAIDDCTRVKVIRIYPRKTAKNAIHFLGEILDDFEFAIQRIQTDWGTEFFNEAFQLELHEHFIKFRPIKPRSPHLNGKVERTQKTDKDEFWSCINLKNRDLDLNQLAKGWQEFYNKKRPHSSLKGKTPWQVLQKLEHLIPIQPDITSAFWDSNEQVKPRNSAFLKWQAMQEKKKGKQP